MPHKLRMKDLNGTGRSAYAKFKRMTGKGWFDWLKSIPSKVGDFFTKTIPDAARKVNDYAKSTKILSKSLDRAPGPWAKAASVGLDSAGYGRGRARKANF
jgi:hypothetical protein